MCCRFDYRFSTYFSSDCTQLRSVQLFNKAYYYYYYYYLFHVRSRSFVKVSILPAPSGPAPRRWNVLYWWTIGATLDTAQTSITQQWNQHSVVTAGIFAQWLKVMGSLHFTFHIYQLLDYFINRIKYPENRMSGSLPRFNSLFSSPYNLYLLSTFHENPPVTV